MQYKIIGTGSKGNCLYLEFTGFTALIDLGVPYKALQGLHYDLIMLTHIHGDHTNIATLRSVIREHPAVWWMLSYDVAKRLQKKGIKLPWDRTYIVNSNDRSSYLFAGASIEAFPLIHDVYNIGWYIEDLDGTSMMYATDTASLDHISLPGLNYYFIEANYDEEEIERVIAEKKAAGEYCYEERVKKVHMSKQQADEWLGDNASAESTFIYMHEHDDAHKDKSEHARINNEESND
jgi:ribonuclease BN (tRNA processing enzyme)